MTVDRDDFLHVDDVNKAAEEMHNDVEERLEDGDLTEDEAIEEHEAIERVLADIHASKPESDD